MILQFKSRPKMMATKMMNRALQKLLLYQRPPFFVVLVFGCYNEQTQCTNEYILREEKMGKDVNSEYIISKSKTMT